MSGRGIIFASFSVISRQLYPDTAKKGGHSPTFVFSFVGNVNNGRPFCFSNRRQLCLPLSTVVSFVFLSRLLVVKGCD